MSTFFSIMVAYMKLHIIKEALREYGDVKSAPFTWKDTKSTKLRVLFFFKCCHYS